MTVLSFTDLLKLKASQMNMSHRQVSLESGLSASYFSKVLNGMIPSLPAFSKIVSVLQCTEPEVMMLVGLVDKAKESK